MNATQLTPASVKLFQALWNDAPNWNGTPLVDLTAEERGNLTQLKRAKLVETFNSDGDMFVAFTDAGRAYAGAPLHEIVPVGGQSARSWCTVHNTYADLEGSATLAQVEFLTR